MEPPIAAEEFHLAMVRAEPGRGAALHSHLTQEVFMPLSERTRPRFGWAASLKEMARAAGLVLDDDGNLLEVAPS